MLPIGRMSEALTITYRFDLPDGSAKTLEFGFDAVDFKMLKAPSDSPPFWAELAFSRCANCPLDESLNPHCPAALQLASALEPLNALVSFDTVGVTVTQAERTVYAQTSAQQATNRAGSLHSRRLKKSFVW